jgi:hypothetical protein
MSERLQDAVHVDPLTCVASLASHVLQISCHQFVSKFSILKRQISSLARQLEDASIDTSIRAMVVELRVYGLHGRFLSVADNPLAPELSWPIRAQETRRSSTSLPSGHSLAPEFSEPIRALES